MQDGWPPTSTLYCILGAYLPDGVYFAASANALYPASTQVNGLASCTHCLHMLQMPAELKSAACRSLSTCSHPNPVALLTGVL